MNSLFSRILLWFSCTLAVTVIASAFFSALGMIQNDSDRRAPAGRLVTLQLRLARSAYETGGTAGLEKFLVTVESVYDAHVVLTDNNGRDLLTHQDRSDLVIQAQQRTYPFFGFGNPMAARAAEDGKYWYFFIRKRFLVGSWFLQPEHLFVFLPAVLLCYWLAYYLSRPVRKLKQAVERFGEGDLSARVNSTRRDELGELARTFDRMADRIETLVNAEHRLLLDISHELRSPLARLGVAVELARSGEDLDANLNRIQKESDRLNQLVGQLLQVTRAEGDPSLLHREPVRLDEMVQQLVNDSRIEAQARGCEVQYQATQPATVSGDPELLRRAVENVIRNAIRYAPEQTAVEVSLARNNGKVLVDVRDRGPGVPEEALPRLFDAFYRVEPDRARSAGGVGLGLSIARRAIVLHHGTIRARNAQPGLEVEMELPVTEP
ncbi:MAG TPA: ATP-binding protein [Bryobacteraceae bacterium]|jgi:two-component system sensor histidine kinase CpxA|nr:ATP-binding protein [Bryobacteraceae bacterium]